MVNRSQAAIFERLETTKKFGLVSEYFVTFTGRSGRLNPKVTVWSNGAASEDVVRRYIASLLKGFVPAKKISVAAD